jgi:hypothetical protein
MPFGAQAGFLSFLTGHFPFEASDSGFELNDLIAEVVVPAFQLNSLIIEPLFVLGDVGTSIPRGVEIVGVLLEAFD